MSPIEDIPMKQATQLDYNIIDEYKDFLQNNGTCVIDVAPARACAVGCLVSAVVAGSSLSRERRPSFATPTECEGHRWSLALWSSLRSRTAYALWGI
jgi:hypothetical protein